MKTPSAATVGSFPQSVSKLKDAADFWLTRFPALYLSIERRRRWINWDKRVYLSFVRKGDVVMDIGANVGTHSILLSHLAGARGEVLSFEPLPANFIRLEEKLAGRARFRNVKIFRMAVGDPKSGNDQAIINVPGDDLTQASLMTQTAQSWQGEREIRRYPVPIVSVDAWWKQSERSRLDFVKIDVEGGELDVLKGGARTFSRFRPLLYCEVYEKWTSTFGFSPKELLSFVEGLGYTDARVIRGATVTSLRLGAEVPRDWFETSSDVLFFGAEHRQRVRRFDERFNVL